MLGIISAAGAILVFFPVFFYARKKRARTRIALAFVAMLAALPAASFSIYYAHILPEASWYYEFRSWYRVELLTVLIGLAGGFIAALLPRYLTIFPLLGTVVFSLVPFIKPIIGPISPGLFSDNWIGNICMQTTPSTFGPASVATVLKSLGIDVSEKELALESYSYAGGTEAWYLIRAIRARGCDAEGHFGTGFDPNIPLPAVVGVRLGGPEGIGHFVALLGREGETYMVGDPSTGPNTYTLQELPGRYFFTGFHMPIWKNAEGFAEDATPSF